MSFQLSIHTYGEPILVTPGKSVTDFDQSLRELAAEMLTVMRQANGIGLAAQQVGLDCRVCVVDLSPCDPNIVGSASLGGKPVAMELLMPLILVNPKLIETGDEETAVEEGCLSFPGINGLVWRPDRIRIEYQDVSGNCHYLECDGLLSRCIQHEMDHLDGILFIQRMEKKVRSDLRKKLRQLVAGK